MSRDLRKNGITVKNGSEFELLFVGCDRLWYIFNEHVSMGSVKFFLRKEFRLPFF